MHTKRKIYAFELARWGYFCPRSKPCLFKGFFVLFKQLIIMELTNGKFSSLYLVEQINVFRVAEGNNYLKYNDLLDELTNHIKSEIYFKESDLFLLFSKTINKQTCHKKAMCALMLFKHLERFNDFKENEMFFILYEQIVLIKLESTKIHSGKRSESIIFSAKNFKIEDYLPSIKNKIYNYSINGKFADLIGDCELTGKKIIVEFKKDAKCGSLQLFGYAKILGCENNCILVNVSESEVKTKQKGVIYLTNK